MVPDCLEFSSRVHFPSKLLFNSRFMVITLTSVCRIMGALNCLRFILLRDKWDKVKKSLY